MSNIILYKFGPIRFIYVENLQIHDLFFSNIIGENRAKFNVKKIVRKNIEIMSLLRFNIFPP